MERHHVNRFFVFSGICGVFLLIGGLLYQTKAQEAKPGERVVEVEIGVDAEAQVREILRQARQLKTNQKHLGAIVQYQKIVSDFPGSVHVDEAQFQIGQIEFHALDSTQSALSAYQKLIDNHPKSEFVPQAVLGKANALLGSRQGGAYDLYTEVVEKFPETDVGMEAKIWKTFLDVSKGQYTYEKAIQIYQQILQDAADKPIIQAHARYAIVGSYYWLGNPDKAVEEIEKLIESGLYTTPRSLSIVYHMAATLYNWQENYAKAAQMAKYVVENYPKMRVADSAKNILEYAQRQLKKANQAVVENNAIAIDEKVW